MAFVVALTACSGSDDAADSTTTSTATESTVTESTVTTTTTTTTPPVATTTSPPATTSTTTEPAPTTTTLEDLRAQIEADLNEGEQALLATLATPGEDDALELLRVYFAGESLEAVLGIHERLVQDGLVGAPSPETPSLHVVLEVTATSNGAAKILNCRVDAGLLLTPDDQAVVNSTVVRYLSENEVVFDGTHWLLSGGTTLTRTEGTATCADL